MSKIAGVVEYVTFDLNQIPTEIKKSEDLKRYILLQTQGRSVEIPENPKTSLTMFAFNIMHKTSPEIVLTTFDGKKHLIYDHQFDPVLREFGMDENSSIKEDFNTLEVSKENIEIDLSNFKNSPINEALEKVKPQIKRAEKTTITGNVPLLLILSVQHLIGNNTNQLFYKKNPDSEPRRVK